MHEACHPFTRQKGVGGGTGGQMLLSSVPIGVVVVINAKVSMCKHDEVGSDPNLTVTMTSTKGEAYQPSVVYWHDQRVMQ